jgi:hypothetical protein
MVHKISWCVIMWRNDPTNHLRAHCMEQVNYWKDLELHLGHVCIHGANS